MQGKRDDNMAQSQPDKKVKSIKVLYSNSHTDRPKISIEGKWLEQLGFHIGDKLQISYGNKFIFISHAADDNLILAVNEAVSAYMAETGNNLGAEQDGACRKWKNMKSRQIKVTSSIHVRQTVGVWRTALLPGAFQNQHGKKMVGKSRIFHRKQDSGGISGKFHLHVSGSLKMER